MSEIDFETAERSTLDRGELRLRLQTWLASKLPGARGLEIPELSSPSSNGMSSETLLFEAQYREDGVVRSLPLVARVAPQDRDVPIFPRYDLASQYRLLELLSGSGVPAPAVRGLENDSAPLGAPFFIMERVEGRVPPDIPPYPFAGWVFDAKPAEREQLQSSTLEAIAALHALDVEKVDAAFLVFDVTGDTPLRRHVQNQRDFYAWSLEDGARHPVIERGFAWLDAHWPSDDGSSVISWGDSRIGNVLYQGFEPAALLDWEMAALGPRELDLAWLCFMHTFFQDIAVGAGQVGLPDFLQLSDVAASYERMTGYAPRDLHWYYTYAALRHAIIMARIHQRMLHFGHAERPEDPDEVIPHRALFERLLDGEEKLSL